MVVVATCRYDYTSGTVGLTNWVQLTPVDGAGASISGNAIPAEVTAIEVFDSSGECLEIGTGPNSAGAKRLALIFPGGENTRFPARFSKGALVWIRAVDVAASTGQILINFYHGRD